MQTIVITGTSTGIGKACVQLFLDSNWYVIAISRDKNPDSHENLKHIYCDMTDAYAVNNAIAQVIDLCKENQLSALINNAGYGQYGPIEDLNRSLLENQMAANFHGPVQLSIGLIPLLRKNLSPTRIIFVSSVLGFTSTPLRGAYSASKHALESIADTLRLELKNTPIKTILIEPGPVATQFRFTACKHLQSLLEQAPNTHYAKSYANFINQSKQTKGTVTASYVANIIYKSVTVPNPKIRYRICTQTWLAWIGKRILSSKIWDYIVLKNQA
ncbi:oxidoreductase [Gammaproteobacteria bacterium]|nr:oxidoreductase [Gammaproteobacteria bacterium]